MDRVRVEAALVGLVALAGGGCGVCAGAAPTTTTLAAERPGPPTASP